MTAADKALTKEEVLAQALECARERPSNEVLTDLMFGRYAALDAGWYWELNFTQKFGSTSQAKSDGDTFARRTRTVITRWTHDVARYEAEGSGRGYSDDPAMTGSKTR